MSSNQAILHSSFVRVGVGVVRVFARKPCFVSLCFVSLNKDIWAHLLDSRSGPFSGGSCMPLSYVTLSPGPWFVLHQHLTTETLKSMKLTVIWQFYVNQWKQIFTIFVQQGTRGWARAPTRQNAPQFVALSGDKKPSFALTPFAGPIRGSRKTFFISCITPPLVNFSMFFCFASYHLCVQPSQ